MRGAGKLDGERRVAVGDETLIAGRAVVVATGSGPAMPPIDGLRGGEALDQPRGHDRQAGARSG